MKTYLTNCVGSGDGFAIQEMVDAATGITRRTFLSHVDRAEMRQIEKGLGYDARSLTMAADWHVSYHKSVYKGQPCVYFCWSAIEYIFV